MTSTRRSGSSRRTLRSPRPGHVHRTVAALLVVLSVWALTGCSSGDDPAAADGAHTVASDSAPDGSSPAAAVDDLSDTALESSTVFVSGEDGYAIYRIPAIIEATDGTLIAFAEGRVATAADDGDVDLLARRSTDGGRTWGDLQVIADMGSDFIGNASPVVDRESGRIILFATYKAGVDTEFDIMVGHGVDTSRQYILTSDDNGITWSEPLEITDSVKEPEWRWYGVGPGHAIQIGSGPHTGRLVAAANHSDGEFNHGSHLLLSDDGGLTWRIGASETPDKGPRHPNEATAAALADGTIVVSSRDQDGDDQWHRLLATSSDGGQTFDAPFADQQDLVVPVVQASLLAVDPAGGDAASTLLLSAPSHDEERVDLRVRASTDVGGTWSEGFLLQPGPAGYSDLIDLSRGLIGILFETGDDVAHERIEFATVGMSLLVP